MTEDGNICSGYALPFQVRYGRCGFSSGGTVQFVARSGNRSGIDTAQVAHASDIFLRLGAAGALAGNKVRPGNSHLGSASPILAAGTHMSCTFSDCLVDDRSIVNFAHLLLAHQDELQLELIEFLPRAGVADMTLCHDPDEHSYYPGRAARLPFELEDQEPESGAYTFTLELRQELRPAARQELGLRLQAWVDAVRGGAYGLAPIPPSESYVEPYDQGLLPFATTVEWTVFKLRADPVSIDSLINLFAAFHERCQEIVKVTIS